MREFSDIEEQTLGHWHPSMTFRKLPGLTDGPQPFFSLFGYIATVAAQPPVSLVLRVRGVLCQGGVA